MQTLDTFPRWQASYSVGNALLDEQHKCLLGLCRQSMLCMADDSRQGTAAFHDILNDLASYVDRHFRTEEALLRSCGYPKIDEHSEQHVEYQVALTDFLLSATQGEIDKAGLHHYLSHWWTNHILGADQAYAAILQDASQ